MKSFQMLKIVIMLIFFLKKKFVKYEVKKMINYSDIKQKKDLFQK